MAASRVSTYHYFIDVHAKLCTCLRHDPDICLISIINEVRIRILWCQPVVNAENRNIELVCYPTGDILRMSRVHCDETSAVVVDDYFIDSSPSSFLLIDISRRKVDW